MKQFLSSSVLATALTISSPSMGKTPESIPGTLGDNQSTTLVDNTNQRTTHTLRAMPDYSSLGSLWFEKNYTEVPSREEQKVAIESGVSKAQDILTHMEKKWVITSDETILEEVFRQGKEQSTRIFHNLETREAGSKEWWKALIELFAIVNFFTLLPWAYGQTIAGAKDGTGTKGITFVAFSGSNLVGMVASFLSWSPLLGSGYAVAFVSAIRTVNALSNRKQLNVSLAIELEEAKRTIQELTQKMAHQGFTVSDNNGHDVVIPYEHLWKHTNFSVYDGNGKPLFISAGLLGKLGYTMEEIWEYFDKHGEVITLFYTEPEEQERVQTYLETLKVDEKGYEAVFFPTSKRWEKLALKFTTHPHPFARNKNPINIRFAEDVTGEHLAKKSLETDLLTAEANRFGFEMYFNKMVYCIQQRQKDQKAFPKKTILGFADMDFLKKINDIYGHGNADIILRELAASFRSHLRPDDCVARLSWDEFGIICEGATKEDIAHKFDKIRTEFSARVFEFQNDILVNTTKSPDKIWAQKFAEEKNREQAMIRKTAEIAEKIADEIKKIDKQDKDAAQTMIDIAENMAMELPEIQEIVHGFQKIKNDRLPNSAQRIAAAAQRIAGEKNIILHKNINHIFIWGITFSMGVTEKETDGENDQYKAQLLRNEMEWRADNAMKYVKHLGKIFPGYESKNGVSYPEYDENGSLIRISVLYHTGEIKVIEWQEMFADAEIIIKQSVEESLANR